jgi:hypothetical protein
MEDVLVGIGATLVLLVQALPLFMRVFADC